MDYMLLLPPYIVGVIITFVITLITESDAYIGPSRREVRMSFTNGIFWPLIIFKFIIMDFIKLISNWK